MTESSSSRALFRAFETATVRALEACGRLQPFEALPKEELIRSACYAMCSRRGTVFVESRYADSPDDARNESDLWLARSSHWDETWVEIKRAWAGPGWTNKPGEQEACWMYDVEKLADAARGRRAFFLVSVFNGDMEHVLAPKFANVTARLGSSRGFEEQAGPLHHIKWGRTRRRVRARMWWWKSGR